MSETTKIMVLACLALWVGPMAACAQDADAPVPIRPFAIMDYSGQVQVEGNLHNQKETTGSTRLQQSEQFFEESVQLRGHGYIYHPNLCELFGMIDLGRLQQFINVNGVNTASGGNLLNYDISALLLKEKPVSARVFASSSSSLVSREFTTPVNLDRSDAGMELLTKGNFPMRLLAEHLTERSVSNELTDQQSTNHLRYSIADQRSNDRTAEFVWDRLQTAETQTSSGGPALSLPTAADDLSLSLLQQFGLTSNPSRLSGQFHWLDRTGFYPDQNRSANVELELGHTPTLSTFYRALASQDQTAATQDRTTEAEVGFRKKIYDSLDITGRLKATDQQFIDGLDERFGGFLDFDYRKSTAIGQFDSRLSLGLEREHETSGMGTRTITETVTLNGVTATQLSKPNIIVGSIVVTSTDHTITYKASPDPNADYILTPLGSFTQMTRTPPTTLILDGAAVLVTYQIAVPRDATWTNEPLSWNNRLKIMNTPFSVFYNFASLEQELVSGDDLGTLNPSHSHLFGLDLDYHGLTATVEHEIQDQVLSPPSRANRVRVNYVRRLNRDADLNVGANAGWLVYENAQQFGLAPGRDRLDNVGAFTRLSMRLNEHTLLNIGGEFNRDSGQQNDELARLTAQLLWKLNQLEFSIEAKNSYYMRETTKGSEQTLLFKIIRRF